MENHDWNGSGAWCAGYGAYQDETVREKALSLVERAFGTREVTRTERKERVVGGN